MIEGGYPNSSGHSGSETSQARAEREDSTGITGKRQRQVYAYVQGHLHGGATCAETERDLGLGHGAASGALTRLHRAGKLTRLMRERDGQQVYVHPVFVHPMESESPYRPNAGPQYTEREILDRAQQILNERGFTVAVSAIRSAMNQIEREAEDGKSIRV